MTPLLMLFTLGQAHANQLPAATLLVLEDTPAASGVVAVDDTTYFAARAWVSDAGADIQVLRLGTVPAASLMDRLSLACLLVLDERGVVRHSLGDCGASISALGEAATTAPSAAPAGLSEALVEALVAMPSWKDRTTRLTELVGGAGQDPDTATRLASALAVCGSLAAAGRDDHSVVRFFLRAALSSDRAVRATALAAAVNGGDPPLVAAGSMALAAPPPPPKAPGVVPAPATAQDVPTTSLPTPADTVAAPHVPDPKASRDYRRQHLARSGVDSVVGGGSLGTGSGFGYVGTAHGWGVRDGTGTVLTPSTFCRRVGDSDGCDRLKRRTTTYLGIGAGLTIGTAIYMGVQVAKQHDETGTFFVGSGIIGGGLGMVLVGAMVPGSWPLSGYTESSVDHLIDGYNARLRERLDLTDEDVLGLGPQAHLQLQPILGPGYIGLAGTF